MNELFFDARKKLGDNPGLHALLVGVGGYPHLKPEDLPPPQGGWPAEAPTFGLTQLSSSAPSAFRIARWLVRHGHQLDRPLKTCRLLLSPTGTERTLRTLEGYTIPAATFDNLMRAVGDWRADAARNSRDLTLFYFAGHGLQRDVDRRRELVALLHDFGSGVGPVLHHAFIAEDLRAAMAPCPASPNMALNQIYIFDACRVQPEQFAEFGGQRPRLLLDYEPIPTDDRNAPIFYTTTPGHPSFGIEGRWTVFCEAMIRCLKGGAGVCNPIYLSSNTASWNVTLQSLWNVLVFRPSLIDRLRGSDFP